MKLIAAHPSPALGFDDFSFRLRGFSAAPLAGRIVMGSCCHQWTMLKLRACASAALEFERCELASSPSCELLG